MVQEKSVTTADVLDMLRMIKDSNDKQLELVREFKRSQSVSDKKIDDVSDRVNIVDKAMQDLKTEFVKFTSRADQQFASLEEFKKMCVENEAKNKSAMIEEAKQTIKGVWGKVISIVSVCFVLIGGVIGVYVFMAESKMDRADIREHIQTHDANFKMLREKCCPQVAITTESEN